jgi:hypothetical protein
MLSAPSHFDPRFPPDMLRDHHAMLPQHRQDGEVSAIIPISNPH